MTQTPTVSVLMITYGHEQFIEQAINSVLMQECDFDFELILANDRSPDATDEIIQSILINNPKASCIKYTIHEKNMGPTPNFIFTLLEAKGRYIAICEGDDYWTDNLKLQKQVDFLNQNPAYNLVGHHALSSENSVIGIFEKNSFDFDEINFRNLRIPTASFVFRNNISYPDWLLNVTGVDRALIFLNAMKGRIKILPFTGSFYRIHPGGLDQYFKKGKFKKPIRNINDEVIYYNLIKNTKNSPFLFKKIIKNHVYIIVYSVLKLKFKYFFSAIHSLFTFVVFRKVKITNKM